MNKILQYRLEKILSSNPDFTQIEQLLWDQIKSEIKQNKRLDKKDNEEIKNYSILFEENIKKVNLSSLDKTNLKKLLFNDYKEVVLPKILVRGGYYRGVSVEQFFEKEKFGVNNHENNNLRNNFNSYQLIRDKIFFCFKCIERESVFLFFDKDEKGETSIKLFNWGYWKYNTVCDFSIKGFLELTLSLFSYEIKENGLEYNDENEIEYLKKVRNKILSLEDYQTSFFYWKLLDFLEISLINENNRVTNNIDLYLEELNNSQTEELSVFNENNEFNKLLDKNQTVIQQKDEKYLHNFVRLKRYIISKRLNILSIIEILKKTSYDKDFEFTKGIIENEIHLYKSVFTYSIVMLLSLKDNKMITFFDIYETLDRLKIFNSNWENEVSQDLKKIDESIIENGKLISEKFDQVINSIYEVGKNITDSIEILSSEINSSIQELNNDINSELKNIDSSIKFNNLLTGISTYQLYKINKNNKSLR